MDRPRLGQSTFPLLISTWTRSKETMRGTVRLSAPRSSVGRIGTARSVLDLAERALPEIILKAQAVNFLLMTLSDDADRGTRP